MIGKTILHYQITEKLGEGGMGVVYKAEDTKLKRTVALKFLPMQTMAGEEEKARFEHEAQAAAALDHPNICTVYEINEAEGQAFIAMAYVEGQSLQGKISSILPQVLNLREVLDIATQIAEGLQAAHEKDIAHRDIKPANILITEKGQVRITDFGLAKLAGRTQLTKEGTTMGTVAYMSPEQTRGEKVDQRTDIWSFGVMLYEMVTGQLPFKGDYEQAVIYSIINEGSEPITGLRTGVPTELERIVDKAMSKSPDDRYQRVDEMLVDLRSVKKEFKAGMSKEPLSKTNSLSSIAVLPFINMSADLENEYFSDGMTEEIINALTHLKDLRVAARTSSFAFKGKTTDIGEVGHKLKVATVLEGSVRKVGNRLRITAQLINVADGYHLWSEKYDRELDDVFAIQDEISLAIVDQLKIKLTLHEEARLVGKGTDNSAAHEAYLKGRYFWNQRGPALKKAVELFQLALTEDDDYAAAYSGLADTYALMGFYGYLSPREVMPKAKEAARRALQIDENLAEAHCSLGFIHTIFDWEWEKAKKEFQQTFELNPSYGPGRYWYSNLLMLEGRLEEAITQVRHGLEYDPLSVYMQTHLGVVFLAAKKYREASEQLRKALELDPNFMAAQSTLGVAYYFQGRVEEGIREIQKAIDSSDRDQWPVALMGAVCAATGDRERAKEILMELKRRAKKEYISAMRIALIYTHLGEKNKAFEWLEKAYAERSSLLFTLARHPSLSFDSLRTDARFEDLLHRIGVRDDH